MSRKSSIVVSVAGIVVPVSTRISSTIPSMTSILSFRVVPVSTRMESTIPSMTSILPSRVVPVSTKMLSTIPSITSTLEMTESRRRSRRPPLTQSPCSSLVSASIAATSVSRKSSIVSSFPSNVVPVSTKMSSTIPSTTSILEIAESRSKSKRPPLTQSV